MTEEADQLQTAEYAARIAQNAEKKLRQLGLTQTDLCDRLKGGVWSPSRATLSRFLGGGYESVTMTSVKVSELAEALKTEVFVLEGSAHTALESYVQLLSTRWAEKLVLPISGRSNFGLPDVFISPKIELTKEPTDPFFTSLESGQLSASDLEFTDMSYRMIEDLVTAIERERNNRRRVDAGMNLPERGFYQSRTGPVQDLADVVNTYRRVICLGEPGAGKTALVYSLCNAFLQKAINKGALQQIREQGAAASGFLLPLVVRCRDLGAPNVMTMLTDENGLLRHVAEVAYQSLGHQTPDKEQVAELVDMFRTFAENGMVFFLIDGIDEFSDATARRKGFGHIVKTISRFPMARFLATTRPSGFRDVSEGLNHSFAIAKVQRFDEDQKRRFAIHWWHAVNENPDTTQLIRFIDANRSFAGNPLMLTCLATVFSRNPLNPPATMIELCIEAINVLWNVELTTRGPSQLSRETADAVLPYIAYEMSVADSKTDSIRIKEDDLKTKLSKYCRAHPIQPYMPDPESFVDLLAEEIWLFSCSGHHEKQRTFEFIHLVFQHFLAAQAMCQGLAKRTNQYAPVEESALELVIDTTEYRSIETWRDINEGVRQRYQHRKEVLKLCIGLCRRYEVQKIVSMILPEKESHEYLQCTPAQRRLRALLTAYAFSERDNMTDSVAELVVTRFIDAMCEDDVLFTHRAPTLFYRIAGALKTNSRLSRVFSEKLLDSELTGASRLHTHFFGPVLD